MCCCKVLILNILNSEDVPTRALEMHASVCDCISYKFATPTLAQRQSLYCQTVAEAFWSKYSKGPW